MMALITSDSGQTDGGGGQVRCIGDDMLSTPIWILWIIVHPLWTCCAQAVPMEMVGSSLIGNGRSVGFDTAVASVGAAGAEKAAAVSAHSSCSKHGVSHHIMTLITSDHGSN